MRIAEELIGKEIESFELQEDGGRITLNIKGGPPVVLAVRGDCCSISWIESIDDEAALLGTVQAVEEIDMPDLGNIDGTRHNGVDQVSYYGLKITTNKGRAVIDYRNDSNGYYGGWIYVERT